MTERVDIGDRGEPDDAYEEELDATAPNLPESVVVNTRESVINETEEETPAALNLEISRTKYKCIPSSAGTENKIIAAKRNK